MLIFSLVSLAAVYGALLVVEVRLLVKFVRGGVVSAMPELDKHDPDDATPAEDDVLAFAY
jgi:cytochrome d ubiquinol oxidase subunit I